jgi:Cytochrome P460
MTISALMIALGVLVSAAPAGSQADSEAAPSDSITLPAGYRDWPLVSVARVGASVNDLRAKLGNDVATKAFREGTRPFPDGAVIVRLAYRAVTSELNNKVFQAAAERQGVPPEQVTKLLAESIVAGPPVNVQIMVKDSKKYASTGGWGFAQFDDGKLAGESVHKTCFSCHSPAKDQDFVFTQYAP